jgi:hypothetical protein
MNSSFTGKNLLDNFSSGLNNPLPVEMQKLFAAANNAASHHSLTVFNPVRMIRSMSCG